jgi:hypothetical protein
MSDHQEGREPNICDEVFQSMGLFLLGQVMGNDEAGFDITFTGTFYHMRVINPAGTVKAHVVGKDLGELAEQLALAIFHDIPEDHLCILHRRPLNKPVQLLNRTEAARPAARKAVDGIMADDEAGARGGSALFHYLGLYLLRLKVGDQDFKIQECVSGETLHVRVKTACGDVVYQVSGQDPVELGDQLALACFHDLTVERLRELHYEPLRKPLHLQNSHKAQ